jgi:hypothetical protein
MLAMVNPALLPAIEAEWRSHLADGLARFRRTPSGSVRGDCDMIRAHPDLYDLPMLLRMAARALTQPEANRRAALSRSYQPDDAGPIFLRRGGLAWQIEQARDAGERARLQAALDSIVGVDTPKAPALRKVLFPLLTTRFGSKPVKVLGSEYRLPLGEAGGVAASLWLDFGRMSRGIVWEVGLNLERVPRHMSTASYEGLLGVGVDHWDMLRTDTVEADLTMLVERVARTLEILQGVEWQGIAWP